MAVGEIDVEVDRRDELRRRIYLLCLLLGIPVLTATWFVHRDTDAFVAAAFPPYVLGLAVVLVGLWRRSMGVRLAEKVVLATNAAIYLVGMAIAVIGADTLADVDAALSMFSLQILTLLFMLAYVAFETQRALQVSLVVFGTFLGIVGVRVMPELLAGRVGGDGIEYLRVAMFLLASIALLHVIAQVKEQAAEARSTASAMTRLANTDVLTGIANRRRLHEALEAWTGAPGAGGSPLAVILLDLDHFKQINDRHGHDVGDEVLRKVAATLAGVVRESDLLGRWGGEEFLIVAPDTDRAAARALAERCRASLAQARFPVAEAVTASFGVAMSAPGDAAWPLLRRADDALYLAKGAGRDRVHGDDDVPAPRDRRSSDLPV